MQFFCALFRKSRSRHSFRTHSHSGFLSFKSLAKFRPILSGGSLLPLLFFISAQINALCSFSVSFSPHFISTPFAHYSSRTEHSEEFPGCAIVGAPRVRSLGISPRVRSPGKNSLGCARSLSLRQLTRKRFGTKRIIRLLPALPIIYKFSQCHKISNSDKCVNNHN